MKSFFLAPEQYEALKGRFARFNEPWTAEETDELRQMAADGVSRAEMSLQLGRSPNAVKMKLQSLGLYVPKPAARPWSAEDDEALVRQYLAGDSFATLASAFGRSERAILSRLVRLRAGLHPESADPSATSPADRSVASYADCSVVSHANPSATSHADRSVASHADLSVASPAASSSASSASSAEQPAVQPPVQPPVQPAPPGEPEA